MFNQGVILWNAGKIADAKKQFEGAIAANPNHAESHYQLGMALVNEGNLAGAATEFETYLKLAPDGAERGHREGNPRVAEEIVIDAVALRARLADVRSRIERAAGRAGRDPASIRLVAVSKTFPADYVRALADAGQIDFGENKVQEALQKMDQLVRSGRCAGISSDIFSRTRRRRPDASTSCTRSTAPALIEKLDEAVYAAGRQLDMLVQVDLAGEPTKHGAREEELAAIFAAGAHGARGPRAWA